MTAYHPCLNHMLQLVVKSELHSKPTVTVRLLSPNVKSNVLSELFGNKGDPSPQRTLQVGLLILIFARPQVGPITGFVTGLSAFLLLASLMN